MVLVVRKCLRLITRVLFPFGPPRVQHRVGSVGLHHVFLHAHPEVERLKHNA